jgi:hypothetical protein
MLQRPIIESTGLAWWRFWRIRQVVWRVARVTGTEKWNTIPTASELDPAKTDQTGTARLNRQLFSLINSIF